jgi:hypothetical protein
VQQTLISTFFDEARTYLDEEDRSVDPKEFKPSAKRCAFILLEEALHSAHQNPVEENWEVFGFCTGHGEWEEDSLAGLYQRLLLRKKWYADMGSMPDPSWIPTRLKVPVLRSFGGHMREVR